MNGEVDVNELFKNADQPDHVLHKVYLLRKLRALKNEAARKNLEVVKSQTLEEINEGTRPAHVSSGNEIETKLKEIANEISSVLDAQSLNGGENEQLPKPSLMSMFDCSEPNLESGITFLSAIEHLSTLYNTPQENSFFQEIEQFVKTLISMKEVSSGNEVERLQAKFLELQELKKKVEEISADENSAHNLSLSSIDFKY